MDSSRSEIEKIIEKIKSIEITYESLLSKTVVSESEDETVQAEYEPNADFEAVKKEIEELKQMLNNDKV